MDDPDFSICCAKTKGVCGKSRHGNVEMLLVSNLNKDTAEHLENIGINADDLPVRFTIEQNLVINRLNLENIEGHEKICPKHCEEMGLSWRANNLCLHPKHKIGKRIGKKRKSVKATKTLSYEILQKIPDQPGIIGLRVCPHHWISYQGIIEILFCLPRIYLKIYISFVNLSQNESDWEGELIGLERRGGMEGKLYSFQKKHQSLTSHNLII